jgi:hypothetical protein
MWHQLLRMLMICQMVLSFAIKQGNKANLVLWALAIHHLGLHLLFEYSVHVVGASQHTEYTSQEMNDLFPILNITHAKVRLTPLDDD